MRGPIRQVPGNSHLHHRDYHRHHDCQRNDQDAFYLGLLHQEHHEFNRKERLLVQLQSDLYKLNQDILKLQIDGNFHPETFSVVIPTLPCTSMSFFNQYQAVLESNRQLEDQIDSFNKKKRALVFNLKQCHDELKRCENYKKHLELLEGISHTSLKPITSPISRFSSSLYQGIPVKNQYSYPALCLLEGNLQGFKYAVNQLEYPLLLENVPHEKQTLEILRIHLDLMSILPSIYQKINPKEFGFFIQQTINDGTRSLANIQGLEFLLQRNIAFDEKTEKSLASWVCLNQPDISLFLSVFKHQQVYFSWEARQLFFANFSMPTLENLDDIYSLYVYYSEFQIQDAAIDLGTKNPQLLFALISKAAGNKAIRMPVAPDLLAFLMENNLECFNHILKHQPEILSTWFNSSEITFHQKYCLIYRAPNLFSLKEVESVFEGLNNYPQTLTLSDDYYHFFNQLVGLEQNKKEMYAVALFKSRVNQPIFQQTPQDIIDFANHLEREWAQAGYSSKSIELMLKFAKNQLLNLVSKQHALSDNTNIEQFMAKHRIKRTLFGIIPIPSTLWWTPSTIMFYQFKRRKQHEVETAILKLAEEHRNTSQAFSSYFAR